MKIFVFLVLLLGCAHAEVSLEEERAELHRLEQPDGHGYWRAAMHGGLVGAGMGLPAFGGGAALGGFTLALGLALKAPQVLLAAVAVGAAVGMVQHFVQRRIELAAARRALEERSKVARGPERERAPGPARAVPRADDDDLMAGLAVSAR